MKQLNYGLRLNAILDTYLEFDNLTSFALL
jgi:hypothetical protein